MPLKPRVCVVTPHLGASSRAFIGRQVTGFREVDPWVLALATTTLPDWDINQIRLVRYAFSPSAGKGPSRWLRRLTHLPTRSFYAPAKSQQIEIRRLLEKERTDVVLCHFGPAALALLPVTRALNIPLVAHFHGYDLSSALRDRWYRWSFLAHLDKLAALIVVGSHQRQLLLRKGVAADRIFLIPCGVPTGSFVPPLREASGNALRVTLVSRLVRWKGVAESIRAFARVIERGIEAELQVVGTGVEESALRALVAELGLEARVSFCGVLGPSRVRDLLAQSDIFIQHSLTDTSGWVEGFGVSLAEAASMELPIVATRSGGIPDQVVDGATGLLVPERDVPAMADAICALAEDVQLRARLGRAGRKRMIEHFDIAQQIAKLEQVLLGAVRPLSPRGAE